MFKSTFIAAGILLVAQTAYATTTVSSFDFTSSSNFTSRPGGYGNTYEISQGELDLNISAFADTGSYTSSGDKLETARVSSNSYGLLTYNQNEGNSQHYVDNYQDRDMLLFDFSKSVALTKLNISYSYNDSDMVVIGFNSLPSFGGGATWSSVASAVSAGTHAVFEIINSGATTGWETFNGSGFEAKYWLVGAYNKYFTNNAGYEGAYDKVKIAGIMTSHEKTTVPPKEVNAPATLGLIALSLLFIRRRALINR